MSQIDEMGISTRSGIKRFLEYYGKVDKKSLMDFFGLKKDGEIKLRKLIENANEKFVGEV